MGAHENLEKLSLAAGEARAMLAQFEAERDELNKRLAGLAVPIKMLQDFIAAWDSIQSAGAAKTLPICNRPQTARSPQADQEAPRTQRGAVATRVESVMGDGLARTVKEVIAAIKLNTGIDENVSSVGMVLKRRCDSGLYQRDHVGKYRLNKPQESEK